MTMFKFRGSSYSSQATRLSTLVDGNKVKYRGQEYASHQAIASTSQEKGLKFRGVTY